MTSIIIDCEFQFCKKVIPLDEKIKITMTDYYPLMLSGGFSRLGIGQEFFREII